MDYFSLNRKQLQTLCKKSGIAANLTNVAMAQALTDLLKDASNQEPSSNEAAVLRTPNVSGITDISNATKEAEEVVSGTILTSDDETPAGMKRTRRNASTVTRKTITRRSTKGKGRFKKAEEEVNVEEEDVQFSSDNMFSIPVSCSKLDKRNRVQAVEVDEGKETAEDQFKQENDAVEESKVRSTRRATRSRACKAEDFQTPRTRSRMGKTAEEKDITTNDCGSGGVEGTGETEKKLMEKEAPTTRPRRKCTEEKLSKPVEVVVVEENARKTNARSVGRNAKPASATKPPQSSSRRVVFDEKPVRKTPATRGRKAKGTLVGDVHDDPTMTISQEALNNPSDEATYLAEVKVKARGGRNPKGSLRNHDKKNEIKEETQPAPQIIQDTEETFEEPASEKQEETNSESEGPESFEGRKYEDAEKQTTLEQKEEMTSEKDECKEIGCSLNSPGRTEQGSQEAISDPAEAVIKSECFEVKEENENAASEAKEVLSNEGTKVLSGMEEESDQKIIEEMILVEQKEADFGDAVFQFEQKSVEEMHMERQQPESSIEKHEEINGKDSEKQEELQEIDEKDGQEGNQESCLEKQNNENDVQERKEENCLEKQQHGQEKPEDKVPDKEENYYVHENCGDRQCQDQEICTIIQESKEVQSEKDQETPHESELCKDMEEKALKSDNDQVAEFGQTVSIEQSDSENCGDKQRQDEEICIIIQEGSKEVQSQRDQEISLESELHEETEEKVVASNNAQFADFVQPVSIDQLNFDNYGGKQRQDDEICMISQEGSKEMESQRDQETPLETELHEEPEKKATSDNDQVAEFGQLVSIEQWDSDIVSRQPDMDKQEEVQQVNKEASSYKPDNYEEGLHEIENASEFCINNNKLKEEQGIEDSKTFIFEMPCENSKPATFDSAIHGSSHMEISNEKASELEEDFKPDEKSASEEHSEKTNTICVAEFVDYSEIGGSFELHQSSGSEYVEKLEQPNFASHLVCDSNSSEVRGEFQQDKNMENKDLQEFEADGANPKMNASEGCVEVSKKASPILDKENLKDCSLGQLRKMFKEMLTLKNEKKEEMKRISSGRNFSSLMRS